MIFRGVREYPFLHETVAEEFLVQRVHLDAVPLDRGLFWIARKAVLAGDCLGINQIAHTFKVFVVQGILLFGCGIFVHRDKVVVSLGWAGCILVITEARIVRVADAFACFRS